MIYIIGISLVILGLSYLISQVILRKTWRAEPYILSYQDRQDMLWMLQVIEWRKEREAREKAAEAVRTSVRVRKIRKIGGSHAGR